MTRLVLVALVVVSSLALQPSPESSLGSQPTPPVVGMSGSSTGAEAAPVFDWNKFLPIAIEKGVLGLVLLGVLWSYRKDFWTKIADGEKARQEERDSATEDRRALIALVEKNTAALVTSQETNARLARAVEAHKLIPPGAGV